MAEKTIAEKSVADKTATAPKKTSAKKKETEASKESSGMKAVIQVAGKQFTVSPGQKIIVDRMEADVGSQVTIDDVRLVSSSGDGHGSDGQSTVLVGTPRVAGAKVNAKILAHNKGKKVIIYKKKRRTGYTKSQGHRQLLTHLRIEEIVAGR
jgi:large subunit ribosomal protein L21